VIDPSEASSVGAAAQSVTHVGMQAFGAKSIAVAKPPLFAAIVGPQVVCPKHGVMPASPAKQSVRSAHWAIAKHCGLPRHAVAATVH
jgi:hypothetical protein